MIRAREAAKQEERWYRGEIESLCNNSLFKKQINGHNENVDARAEDRTTTIVRGECAEGREKIQRTIYRKDKNKKETKRTEGEREGKKETGMKE